jgi:hypothetical protein
LVFKKFPHTFIELDRRADQRPSDVFADVPREIFLDVDLDDALHAFGSRDELDHLALIEEVVGIFNDRDAPTIEFYIGDAR